MASCGSDATGGGPVDAASAADAADADDASACAPAEQAVANESWAHVPEGTPIAYAANPPASGRHFPRWGRYMQHAAPLARGYWVHNLEHGAIVLLYRPDAPAALRAALVDAYAAIPNDASCGHRRALLTADPDLDVPVAAVAANLVLESDCVSREAILAFVAAHRGMGPENVCNDGSVP